MNTNNKNQCQDNVLNAGFCKVNPKNKNRSANVEESRNKVNGATHLEKFISNMQRERSEVAFYIFTYGKQSLGLNLSERFKITDGALERTPWPDIKESKEKEMFKSKLRFQIRHGDFRQRIKTTNSSTVWKYLIAYVNLLRCIENLGIAVAYGIRYYGQGKITYDNYIQYIRHITLGDEYLEQSQNYVPFMKDLYQKIKSKGVHYSALQKSRKAVLAQIPRQASTGEALKFYQATFGYTEALRDAIRDLRLRIEAIVVEELKAANRQQAFGIMILISVLIITDEIKFERKKVNRILIQLLPKKYGFLKTRNKVLLSDQYESLSILKADVEDFQVQIKEFGPIEIVIFLNSIYKLYEDCIEKYKVHKVDYMDDSCLVAGGIEDNDKVLSHAAEIAKVALELLGQSTHFITPNKPKYRLKLRIGIHTGTRHCLIHNTGALMIHLSEATNTLLQEVGGFHTEPYKILNLTPMGLTQTYCLFEDDMGYAEGNTEPFFKIFDRRENISFGV
ncbi:unnamed protein product [Lepeophtheirus salmonis]|uniref:(salmon louse) hypothetical protein n=1 Tax=Lepeophtheirus salmonis TaxID=72036 RepID=A0A7R8H9R1_LEPSM|nr:unnamed protein product [Lepeophtheirus salmonis]CAF2959398.1 unnamed protein product [Lepeophtheirus salmonis]